MTKEFVCGVGTSPSDEIFKHRGQASKRFLDWLADMFGGHGKVPPPNKSLDGRTLTFKDEKKGVTVTSRSDRDGRNVKSVRGSIDVKSQVRTPKGKIASETKHFGYLED